MILATFAFGEVLAGKRLLPYEAEGKQKAAATIEAAIYSA